MSPRLPKWGGGGGGEKFSERSVALGQKILMSKRGCIMGRDNFGV